MASIHEGRERIAGPDDAGRRLDKILRVILGDRALSEIYAALRKGRILVNGAKAGPELRVAEGDRIFIHASLSPAQKPSTPPGGTEQPSGTEPSLARDAELVELADILVLATKDLLFVNKPRGELSQDGEGQSSGISRRVREALSARSSASLSFVPGALHRLDRNTTGILTFPRSAAGARAFSELVRERKLRKLYLALADGEAGSAAEWTDRIARDGGAKKSCVDPSGEEAHASMRPLLSRGGQSLILVELHSGLTHQIRVQASSRGLPLSGDGKYGGSPFGGGYILHAAALLFPEPPFPDLPAAVAAPLPKEARRRLETLFGAEELAAALAMIPF
jgi:23S rRNA pseudouridine955/2504/2580 synthase